MTITEARRIVAFRENKHMDYERLASTLNCSVPVARSMYYTARSMADTADARKAVAQLNEIAARCNVTATELMAMYA